MEAMSGPNPPELKKFFNKNTIGQELEKKVSISSNAGGQSVRRVTAQNAPIPMSFQPDADGDIQCEN